MNRLKLWNEHSSWEDAEASWKKGAEEAAKTHPLKILKSLPDMPGITEETAKNLKWKALKYMLSHDNGSIRHHFNKHPFRYGKAFLKSIFQKKPYSREGDFFYYGIKDLNDFKRLIADPERLLVVGFSYCHKPFECPSGRFSDQCIHNPDHPVCRQCFIGKAVHALPEKNVFPLFIPTIHYIGEKIFELVHSHPNAEVIFMITACEMTLEMFGDWGNMVAIKGIGVRLDGRICNTMRAFELSEKGIKPGLTVVLEETKHIMLDLIRLRREKLYHLS